MIDSRENKPFEFRKSINVDGTEVVTLNAGDYSIKGREHQIAIERKNPTDAFGSVTAGNKRFQRELERARSLDYFAIVIEASYSDILNRTFDGGNFIKVKGHIVLKTLFTLKFKYKVDLFFCQSRQEAAALTRSLLVAYNKLKEKEEKENGKN